MARILPFRSAPTVDEEACAWYARIDAGLDESSRIELRQWLASDPRHRVALARIVSLWGALEPLKELAELFPLQPVRPVHRRAPVWLVAAAACSAVGGIAFVLGGLVSPVTKSLPEQTTATSQPADARATVAQPPVLVSTRIGERRTERLTDGSVALLNTATTLRVEMDPMARRLTLLQGEAQFDVSHDARRPFIVTAGARSVRAVGTAFNVRLNRDYLEVVVTEGRVSISDPKSNTQASPTVEVSAGEAVTFSPGQATVTRGTAADTNARLAWQRGLLVFNGEHLSTALAEVERYTDIRFEIPDPRVRNLRIGGTFETRDIDGLLYSLEHNFSLRVSRHDNRVVIEPIQ